MGVRGGRALCRTVRLWRIGWAVRDGIARATVREEEARQDDMVKMYRVMVDKQSSE
jgi:hypothetical protein